MRLSASEVGLITLLYMRMLRSARSRHRKKSGIEEVETAVDQGSLESATFEDDSREIFVIQAALS